MNNKWLTILGVIFGMAFTAWVVAMAVSSFGGLIQGPPNDSVAYQRAVEQVRPQTLEDQSSRPIEALTPPQSWATRGTFCSIAYETMQLQTNSTQCVVNMYRRPNGAVVIQMTTPTGNMHIVADDSDFHVIPNFVYGMDTIRNSAFSWQLEPYSASGCFPADSYIYCTFKTRGEVITISMGE